MSQALETNTTDYAAHMAKVFTRETRDQFFVCLLLFSFYFLQVDGCGAFYHVLVDEDNTRFSVAKATRHVFLNYFRP